MTINSTAIIDALGGTVAVAKLCDVKPQAVSQWFGTDPQSGGEREIPRARLMYLKVVRPEVFTRLEAEAKAVSGGV
jgi:hypothetical protein